MVPKRLQRFLDQALVVPSRLFTSQFVEDIGLDILFPWHMSDLEGMK